MEDQFFAPLAETVTSPWFLMFLVCVLPTVFGTGLAVACGYELVRTRKDPWESDSLLGEAIFSAERGPLIRFMIYGLILAAGGIWLSPGALGIL